MNVNNLIDSEVSKLIDVLPETISKWVRDQDLTNLVEIVMDFGRNPELRYMNSFMVMEDYLVTASDLSYVLGADSVSSIAKNNRCGISGTLHRISCIENRTQDIIGLTLRVGRVIKGGIDLIQDLIDTGESILMLGRPGVGKTSKLRETCKYLSEDKNQYVVIVDTSNEIAGEGNQPHPSVGRSRRMMVPFDRTQDVIMIEAVENHMPHVIVIDEISKEAEAEACRTVAERGVQLIATAHGETLENLKKNKPLTPLIGKVSAHTVSDEVAESQNNGRKTRLEREMPSTFKILIELLDYDRVAVHYDIEKSIDNMLLGWEVQPEIRRIVNGKILIEQKELFMPPKTYVKMEPARRIQKKTR